MSLLSLAADLTTRRAECCRYIDRHFRRLKAGIVLVAVRLQAQQFSKIGKAGLDVRFCLRDPQASGAHVNKEDRLNDQLRLLVRAQPPLTLSKVHKLAKARDHFLMVLNKPNSMHFVREELQLQERLRQIRVVSKGGVEDVKISNQIVDKPDIITHRALGVINQFRNLIVESQQNKIALVFWIRRQGTNCDASFLRDLTHDSAIVAGPAKKSSRSESDALALVRLVSFTITHRGGFARTHMCAEGFAAQYRCLGKVLSAQILKPSSVGRSSCD